MYSEDIIGFDDIKHFCSEFNREINSSVCQDTGQKLFVLLKLEQPYLIKTDLGILTGYFVEFVSTKVGKHYLKYTLLIFDGSGYLLVDENAVFGFFQFVSKVVISLMNPMIDFFKIVHFE